MTKNAISDIWSRPLPPANPTTRDLLMAMAIREFCQSTFDVTNNEPALDLEDLRQPRLFFCDSVEF